MSKLKRNYIELVKNVEEVVKGGEPEFERFWTPPFLPWRVVREAVEVMAELQKNNVGEWELIDKMAEFVANRIYQNQFTVDDLYDRLHAPNANEEIVNQVRFIAGGQQDETKN